MKRKLREFAPEVERKKVSGACKIFFAELEIPLSQAGGANAFSCRAQHLDSRASVALTRSMALDDLSLIHI